MWSRKMERETAWERGYEWSLSLFKVEFVATEVNEEIHMVQL